MGVRAIPVAAQQRAATRAWRVTAWRLVLFVLIAAGSALFVVPFLWMVTSSIKAPGDIWVQPPRYVPYAQFQPRWRNYADAWNALPFGTFLANSLIITLTATATTTFTSAVVAFGFARLRFRFRDALFLVVLSTMMLPSHVTLIPLFVLFKQLGWLNTFKPLIVPPLFGSAFYIFLLRQFFLTLPIELDEAARLDGCSSFGILWRIVAPLSGAALATVALFSFIGHWNDFLGPLIYLNDLHKMTLAVGLQFFKGDHASDWHLLMAASTWMVAPIVVVVFFTQKLFIQGIALTGLKG